MTPTLARPVPTRPAATPSPQASSSDGIVRAIRQLCVDLRTELGQQTAELAARPPPSCSALARSGRRTRMPAAQAIDSLGHVPKLQALLQQGSASCATCLLEGLRPGQPITDGFQCLA